MNEPTIARLTRVCPRCDALLLVRENRDTGHKFFGCRRWPDCSYTLEMGLDVRLREAGHQTLPGFDL